MDYRVIIYPNSISEWTIFRCWLKYFLGKKKYTDLYGQGIKKKSLHSPLYPWYGTPN